MTKNETIRAILTAHDVQHSDYAISTFSDMSTNAKNDLRAIFTQSPHYNDDLDAIVLTTDYSETRALSDVTYKIHRSFCALGIEYLINGSVDAFANVGLRTLTARDIGFADAPQGQKASKYLQKIVFSAELKASNDYNADFAIVADWLSPKTIKETTVISLHPADFLTMSAGTGWQSCHHLQDGCYRNGITGLALDSTTFVYYTLTEDDAADAPTKRKKTRQLFSYANNVLIQHREYPRMSERSETARATVQQIIANALQVPNLWIKNKEISAYVTHDNARHYNDLSASHVEMSQSTLKDSDSQDIMTIGHDSLCLGCGEIVNFGTEASNYCEQCAEEYDRDGQSYCDECGGWHDDEYMHYCEDTHDYRCDNCAYYCDECGNYFSETHEAYTSGSRIWICENCLQDDFISCDHCGDTHHMDDVTCANEYVYCEDCAADQLRCCEECGEYVSRHDAQKVDGVFICNDCIDDACGGCDTCGEFHLLCNLDCVEGVDGLHCDDCTNVISASIDVMGGSINV